MMLEILIIDDKEQKIDALRQVITPLFAPGEVEVDEARTIVDARDKMRSQTYDLVILDMVIPELEDEEPSHTAGAEFLTEIYENQDIHLPLQVIGLTEYEAEFDRQKEEFRDRLWYLLFYSQRDLEWKKMLKAKVRQLAKMKSDFITSLENRGRYDVGIICALSEEFEQMQHAFDGCVWDDCRLPGLPFFFRTTVVTTNSFRDLRVIAACAERPGVCATSILATAMYTVARVEALFMTGITAGVKDGTLKLNDVIIADSVVDYATGKLADTGNGEVSWLREIHEASASTRLLSAASSAVRDEDLCEDIKAELLDKHLMATDTDVKLYIAKTVCGPFVVASSAIVDILKSSDRKLQAIDMEGFGLYLTAHSLERQALWIKAVCDFADRSKGDAYHKSCSYASAAFLFHMLREKF